MLFTRIGFYSVLKIHGKLVSLVQEYRSNDIVRKLVWLTLCERQVQSL